MTSTGPSRGESGSPPAGLTPLLTRWGESLDRDCPLNEYPRPQMRRDQWECLNGPWLYAIRPVKPQSDAEWEGEIVVPFSPESLLSGVGRQLLPGQTLWYHREVTWVECLPGQRRLLHFGAVDQRCQVWVNGALVGSHVGGYWPFVLDVTAETQAGVNVIELAVQDDSDAGIEAYGKQKLRRGGIWYTAQSGVWQTVWSELVPEVHIVELVVEPRLGRSDGGGAASFGQAGRGETRGPSGLDACDTVSVRLIPSRPGAIMPGDVTVLAEGAVVATAPLHDNEAVLQLPRSRRWTPDDPYLYDIEARAGTDRVTSYVGLREFGVGAGVGSRPCLTLNGRPIFHNGLLDQGYWSDGLYTPPSDEAMVHELTTLKSLGYTMVRKHIKIEPLRWYYHCDRLGLLVWQDCVSGGGPYNRFVIQAAPWLGLNFGDGPRRYGLHGRSSPAGRQAYERDLARTVSL
ncbi:MAG: hypothetical protein LBV00_06940, partial [Propionibacteriaceae bacterium]|nr:hypothetical protein [Propionibacteriaceae bacterium]